MDPLENPETPQQNTQAQTTTPQGRTDAAYFDERISSLNKDLSGERKKLKAAETERDEYKSKVLAFETTEKKRTLFDKVVGSLGEEFVLENDARGKLTKAIAALPDSDDLESIIIDMVDVAKRPASKGKMQQTFGSGMNLGGGDAGVPEKDPKTYTNAELLKIQRDDPDRYREIRKARL